MIKFSLFILLAGLWSYDVSCQQKSCDSTYTFVDEMPIYQEGIADLVKYLSNNLIFETPCRPEELKRLTWTINAVGKMVEIDVIGLEGKCKSDIIEQLEMMPNWTPGKLNGKIVCVKLSVPIHIRPSY